MLAPTHIPLSLSTKWFANPQAPTFPYPALLALPTPIRNHAYTYECSAASTPPDSKNWTFIGVVQWDVGDGRAATKVKITWNSERVGEARGEQKVITLQRSSSGGGDAVELSRPELERAAVLYGGYIVDFCRGRLGRVVGDGECWTLAVRAKEAAGEVAGREGFRPLRRTVGRVHGQVVLDYGCAKGVGVGVKEVLGGAGVRPGDILEFVDAKFVTEERVLVEGGWRVGRRTVSMGKHTAVLEGVGEGEEGDVMEVFEQNGVGGVVERKVYKLSEMQGGQLMVYRAVGEETGAGGEEGVLTGVCDTW
ncbi:hypothetical protein FQN50_000254 [Emmonsiellopsis sp. PD_5]|nr:hypothetical protein FQN50_000254 [Emmonsiellopsis sp. PD_5]